MALIRVYEKLQLYGMIVRKLIDISTFFSTSPSAFSVRALGFLERLFIPIRF
jgi:hypothetical protein